MNRWIMIIITILMSIMSCNKSTITSQIAVDKPVIDGVLDEWGGKLFSTKGEKLGFGVMNDDSTLYIAMTTYDIQVIKQVLRGLTIWIDPSSKRKKSFGIKYPLKTEMSGFMDIINKNLNQNEDIDFLITQRLLQQNSLQYIKYGVLQYNAIDNGEKGIQIKMSFSNGELSYELKVPFSEYSYEASEKISLGFESAQMPGSGGYSGQNSGHSRGGRGGGMSGGGMSGGGKGSGQRSGGAQGKMKNMPGPVNIWLDIGLNFNTDSNGH